MSHKKIIFTSILSILILTGIYYTAANYGYFSGGTNAPSVPEDTMTRGLVGYWEFDEGTGQTAYDGSENSNDGTLGADANAGADDPKWGAGKNGGGMEFDGVDDYVDVGNDSNLNITDAVTIEAWVNLSAKTSDMIISSRGIPQSGWILWWDAGDDRWEFFIRDSVGGYHYAKHDFSPNIGQWYHIVGRWDGSELSIYVDNVKGSTTDTLTTPFGVAGDNLYIGSRDETDTFFNGSIDSVRIYNRALSADEVRYHYNRGGPVGAWGFDEGSGLTAFDSTENNNDGTLKSSGLEFDGVDDYVDAGNVGGYFGGDNLFSVSMWIKTLSLNGTVLGQEIAYGDGTTIKIDNGKLCGTLFEQGHFICTSVDYNDNKWHHIVLNRPSISLKEFYVDGILIDSNADGGVNNDGAGGVYIGSDFESTNYFNGSIDEVRIYNTALSAEEIARQYNGDFSQDPTANLVLLQHFEEGMACDANSEVGCLTDDSPSGTNDGTLYGFDNLTAWDNGTDGWVSDVKKESLRWTNGKYKTAGNFDGGGDNVSVADNSQFSISNFQSISQFLNFKTLAAGKSISGQWGNSQNRWLIKTDDTDADEIKVCVASGLTDDCVNYGKTTSADLTADNWYHLYAVYDYSGAANGDKLKVYLNGAEQSLSFGGTIPSSLQDSSEELEFGGDSDIASFADVKIDDVKFYDYVRTADEIRLDYNAGVATHLGPSDKTCSEDPAGCMDYGLVGSWGMDEGAGTTAYDSSDNSNDGSLEGGPKWTTDSSPLAGGGGSLKFDGVDDYVTHNSISFDDASPHTYGTWLKWGGGTVSNFMLPFGDKTAAHNTIYLASASGAKTFQYRTSVGARLITGVDTTELFDGEWHHLIWTVDSNRVVTVYIDGAFNGDATISETDMIYNGIARGYSTNAYNWNGSIDDVRIYNRALSAEEVRYHYNKGGPVAEWKFDEGSGTNVYDSSGNLHHGTLTE